MQDLFQSSDLLFIFIPDCTYHLPIFTFLCVCDPTDFENSIFGTSSVTLKGTENCHKRVMCLIHISYICIYIHGLICYVSHDWQAYSFMMISITNRTKCIFSETAFSRKSICWVQNVFFLFLHFITIFTSMDFIINLWSLSWLHSCLTTLEPETHHLFRLGQCLVTASPWFVQPQNFGPVTLGQTT